MNPPRTPSSSALLRWQFHRAHTCLDAAIEGLTTEMAQRCAPGTAASAGVCYAQIVLCEDLSVNGVLAAGTPLALSTWVGRTGLSDLPPLAGPIDWRAWAQRVRLDLATLRRDAHVVYAATDRYLAALPDSVRDPARDETWTWLLSALLLTLAVRSGEIGCLRALEHQPAADEPRGSYRPDGRRDTGPAHAGLAGMATFGPGGAQSQRRYAAAPPGSGVLTSLRQHRPDLDGKRVIRRQ